jgi:hypothetical protein
MISALLEWWGDLSPGWRYGVALLFLVGSTLAWLVAGRIWVAGFGIGAALFVAASFNFDS